MTEYSQLARPARRPIGRRAAIRRGLAGLGLAALAVMAPAKADVVTLVDGSTIEGRLLRMDERQLHFEVTGGRIFLDAAMVDSVAVRPWTPPEPKPEPVAGSAAEPASDSDPAGDGNSVPDTADSMTPSEQEMAAARGGTDVRTASDRLVHLLVTSMVEDGSPADSAQFVELGDDALPSIAAAIRDANLPKDVRIAMARALSDRGGHLAAIPDLVALAHDRDPIVSEQSIWALEALGEDAHDAAPALRRVAQDGIRTESVRAAAVLAYSSCGGKDELALAASLLASNSAMVRLRCVQVLESHAGSTVNGDVIASLGQLLDHPDPKVREDAVRAIALVGDDFLRHRVLETIRRDLDPGVRCAAIRSLRDSDSAQAAAVVREAAASANAQVRRIACAELGQREDTTAVDLLISRLYDADRGVRASAAKALQRITGEDLGASVDRWRAWWRSKGQARFGSDSTG